MSLVYSEEKKYALYKGDINDLSFIPDKSVDIIITDPPYPIKYLPLFELLAIFSKRVLKEGGSAFIMSGQTYVPEVINLLSKHLTYHWTMNYYMPGTSYQAFHVKVINNWKPIFWYINGKEYHGKWIKDTVTSLQSDKRYHKWGQSISGLEDIIKNVTEKTDIIMDPFVGGGSTALACYNNERYFIGSDINLKCLEITHQRLVPNKLAKFL